MNTADCGRSRTFTGILYPDSTDYDFQKVIDVGMEYFDEFGYILHNRDITDLGELKKHHIHWVGRKKNAVKIDFLQKVLNVPLNSIEYVKNWKKCVQYLIHYNQPEKTSYDIDEIKGSIIDLSLYFCNMSEGQAVIKMIKERESGLTYRQILFNAVEQGYYSEFRRNIGVIDLVCRDLKNLVDNGKI